ncbi:MAG: hypothetical protein KBS68_07640 [Clostridiales bacterium]|nr:hypothetical protein [Candidatus Crickella merdequi]
MDYDTIFKYAKELKELPYSLGDKARILVQEDKETYQLLLADEPVQANLTQISGSADYAKSALVASDYNYMIIAQSPYIAISAQEGKDLPAVLDDMGMIIGLKAPVTGLSAPAITKGLRRTRACICSDGYALCCGTDMYEAFTCHTILAKDAEIYHKAKVLGGAKPIHFIAGLLENRVYKMKYSKLERSDK